MHKALEQKLIERWPTWFNTGGDIRHTLMPRGFTHDDGWFDILWRLCEDLEPLVAQFEQAIGRQFEVLQVKEKFGGLRMHVNHANDAIRQRIETAIQESFPYLRGLRPSRGNCGKVVGSRLCAANTRVQTESIRVVRNLSGSDHVLGLHTNHTGGVNGHYQQSW